MDNTVVARSGVLTGLQRVPGSRPPVWVRVHGQKKPHIYRIEPQEDGCLGEPFEVRATSHMEAMCAVAEELRRRQLRPPS